MDQPEPVHKIQRVQQLPCEIPHAVARKRGVVVLLHKIVQRPSETLEDEAVVSIGQGKTVVHDGAERPTASHAGVDVAEYVGFDEGGVVVAFYPADYFDGYGGEAVADAVFVADSVTVVVVAVVVVVVAASVTVVTTRPLRRR